MARAELRQLEARVPRCRRCPRLRAFLQAQRSAHPDYWCKPVPGFGDPGARIVLVGLAPGLHGANRTGRPFQGDASGEWLYRALGELGRWNGRSLRGVYIANAVKCVPPGNLPSLEEQEQCRPWLVDELAALSRARVLVALGGIAHRAVLRSYALAPLSRHPFGHAVRTPLPDGRLLLSSFHPSRQNTNTGRLTWPMWKRVLRAADRHAFAPAPPAGSRPRAR